LLSIIAIGCKKSYERSCFKGTGDIDSVVYEFAPGYEEFILGTYLKYEFYQDSSNSVVIRGGKNMIYLVEVVDLDTALQFNDKNMCNFLRNGKDEIIVELHFPSYTHIVGKPSDSVIFKDTISGDVLTIDFKNGAGSSDLKVNLNILVLSITTGAGDFRVGGNVAVKSDLVVKQNAWGDASDLNCPYYFIHSRTNGDLHVNLNGATADIFLTGTGDIYYAGTPADTNLSVDGDGNLIAE